MIANPYAPPAADLEPERVLDVVPTLWNPGVAAGLGFFFSPIFGAIINMKNWQAMGEPAKARQSMMWIYGTIAFYVVMILLALVLPDNPSTDWIYRPAGIGFFAAWYMMSGKDQRDVVEYRYGATYAKRGWTKPVLITMGLYIGFIFIVGSLIMLLFPDVNAG